MTLLVGFALVSPKLPVSGMKDKDADVVHLSVMLCVWIEEVKKIL